MRNANKFSNKKFRLSIDELLKDISDSGLVKLDFEPQTRFLKSIKTKNEHYLSKINENLAFHTHFIDFGGVGTNETG